MSMLIKGVNFPKVNEIMLIGITSKGEVQVGISKAPSGVSKIFKAEAVAMFRHSMAETHKCVLRKLLKTRKIEEE